MKKIVYVLSVIAFLSSGKVVAAYFDLPCIFDEVNNSAIIGFRMMHLNYKEDIQGIDSAPSREIISNKGNVFGAVLGGRSVFFDWLYTDFEGEYFRGKPRYDGKKKSGSSYQSVSHTSMCTILNLDLKAGPVAYDHEHFQFIPYLGAGFHYLNQNSRFKYHNFKGLIGAKVNISLFHTFVLSPYYSFGMTFMPRSSTEIFHPTTGEFIGSVDHKLGNEPIHEFGLEVNYKMDSEIFLTGLVSYTRFKYGRSTAKIIDGLPANDNVVVEPDSTTTEIRLGIGIRFSF